MRHRGAAADPEGPSLIREFSCLESCLRRSEVGPLVYGWDKAEMLVGELIKREGEASRGGSAAIHRHRIDDPRHRSWFRWGGGCGVALLGHFCS